MNPILYTLRPADPAAHRFEISCRVASPDPAGQCFSLPAWIPGSYLIRDFARNVLSVRAEAGGRPVDLEKRDKHTWQAPPLARSEPLTIRIEVYAWDLSVRGAHLDGTHGFFNGTSVFLRVVGQEASPCLVDILPPDGAAFKDWQVATALEPAHGERHCAGPAGFGRYRAGNYDELIDHPVEMGRFSQTRFEACGVPHTLALTGRHDADLQRLTDDLRRLCAWQIGFFGEPAPMPNYAFLVTTVGEGYGGLEHRASTALLCAREDLPHAGMRGLTEGYRRFLGLCSHEYFHTWHVKRIKPAAFVPYRLDCENHTGLLWVFEGFTSYYDDLALLRCGLITVKDWLELLGKTISGVQRGPGRLRQSLVESSFDAWIKYYRPDENTPNAVVSYYAKGALVAMLLDLTLRLRTAGRRSLDDLMRELWQRYGQTGNGVEEDAVQAIAEELAGVRLERFFAAYVRGTAELPLKSTLARFGVRLEWHSESQAGTPSLGVKTANEDSTLRLSTVYDGSAAQAAGLSSGDTLLAIDGLRVTPGSLDKILARRRPGDTVRIHAFRRDELMEFSATLAEAARDTARLSLIPGHHALRRGWFAG